LKEFSRGPCMGCVSCDLKHVCIDMLSQTNNGTDFGDFFQGGLALRH